MAMSGELNHLDYLYRADRKPNPVPVPIDYTKYTAEVWVARHQELVAQGKTGTLGKICHKCFKVIPPLDPFGRPLITGCKCGYTTTIEELVTAHGIKGYGTLDIRTPPAEIDKWADVS